MAQQQQQQPNATSPMSITQLCNFEQQQQRKKEMTHSHDSDVQIAAEALGDMARSGIDNKDKVVLPPISSPPSLRYYSFSSDSSAATTINEHEDQQDQQQQQQQRIASSDYTLVNSAWKAFQTSKESVKYGAEMVESLTAPIYERYGSSKRPSIKVEDEEDATLATAKILAKTSISDHPERNSLRHRRNDSTTPIRSRPSSRSTSPHRPYTLKHKSPAVRHHKNNKDLQTSRWQQLILHASSAAGTTAAVVSEESMKCLRYCLSWLQYAMQHIERQMALLRSYLVSLATHNNNNNNNSNNNNNKSTKELLHQEENPDATVASIKKEMVDTVRKVVDIVSRYASSSLPEQAKNTVRSYILELPKKWQVANSSTTLSPMTNNNNNNNSVEDPQLHETSIKLLNFGGESIEMLQSVSDVFSDTVDRADLWLDRLRVMGVTSTSTTTTTPHNDSRHYQEPSSSTSSPPPPTPMMMDINP
ncbi:transcription factor Opi1-domain-containing protein [Circinella umbellata]|nr:transcription factor Opi1-domain-containing protein [Circinella umbellata]